MKYELNTIYTGFTDPRRNASPFYIILLSLDEQSYQYNCKYKVKNISKWQTNWKPTILDLSFHKVRLLTSLEKEMF